MIIEKSIGDRTNAAEFVIPAQAGIHELTRLLKETSVDFTCFFSIKVDTRLRGYDKITLVVRI